MTTRYIRVPQDIEIEDVDGSRMKTPQGQLVEPAKFSEIASVTCVDSKLISTYEGLETSFTIRAKLKGAKPGSVVEVDEDDFKRWLPAVKTPDAPLEKRYNPFIAAQLFPFLKAIVEATTTRPE